ncbi:MAG: hypothetical protein WCG47_21855 [Dermatophilaceae bacterium]
MGRTATKAQQARAREARLALLEKRNAQDERIEEATAAGLLAWQDWSAAQTRVEQAERAAAAALGLLCREKVLVRDMVALTGIEPLTVQRLLRLPVESRDSSTDGSVIPSVSGEDRRVAGGSAGGGAAKGRPRPVPRREDQDRREGPDRDVGAIGHRFGYALPWSRGRRR